MGRSGKFKASNDKFVLEVINDPLFKIERDGTILSRRAGTGQIYLDPFKYRVAGTTEPNGYRTLSYKTKKLSIHRIIYAKFLAGTPGNPPLAEDLLINHKDNNPSNNAVENLELVTASENSIHSFRTNNRKPVYGHFKISFEIANQIRTEHLAGMSYRILAAKYKLCKGSISDIVNYRTWNNPEAAQ